MNRSHALRAPLIADLLSRWATCVCGVVWVTWRTGDLALTGPWLAAVAVYLAVALGATILLRPLFTEANWPASPCGRWGWVAIYAGLIADALFGAALIWRDGGLASPLYLLLFLGVLRAVAWSAAQPGILWAAFALGPLYALALWLETGSLAFLADDVFLARYVLLWAWLIGGVLVGWALARRTRQAAALEAALSQQGAALAQKTEVLQRTATDLGDRVLELRSLQEIARALASTLGLEETLEVVAERLRDVTGSHRSAAALIEADPLAPDGAQRLAGTLAADDAAPAIFRLPLAGEAAVAEALRLGQGIYVAATAGDSPLGQLLGGDDYSVTPLTSRGRAIGALFLAAGPDRQADVKARQLVESFAYFAATAIENAQLYQDAWEKRRELEAVLAGIGDGVVVVDPQLRLILMNPVARAILALAEAPPLGASLRGHLATEGAFAGLLEETLTGQRELIRELVLPDLAAPERDGPEEDHTRTFGALASPVIDADGDVSGVVAVLRDITAQKELERMKSNFLSVVSHELRTPLHSIKGFVEIILMGKTGPVTELQEDFLRTVRTQTTALQRMIDDLLEFSRMEAGRVRLHMAEVPLLTTLQGVVAKLAPLAEEAGLELFVDLPDDLPEIEGDRMRLEQVFTNLVENAIKFTPAGGRVVVHAAAGDDKVRLTVSDSGIGIPPDELERIFGRFYQVDGSERRAYRGAGLGLSICKHIVERHRGRIWAESEGLPGRGSQFHVELPVELRLSEAPTIDFTTSAGQVRP
jgi:two-component system NtrC family sensor kinase